MAAYHALVDLRGWSSEEGTASFQAAQGMQCGFAICGTQREVMIATSTLPPALSQHLVIVRSMAKQTVLEADEWECCLCANSL